MPNEADIERVMRDTGMERMQAINHLRGRADAQRVMRFTNGSSITAHSYLDSAESVGARERIRSMCPELGMRYGVDQLRNASWEMLHALKWIADNTGGAARDVALGAIAKAIGE